MQEPLSATNNHHLYAQAVELLQQLIAIPSFSKEEDKTAELLAAFMQTRGIEVKRKGNNVWAVNKHYDLNKPSLLLNSHHDTVKPNANYTFNPFSPIISEGKLFGLGSNDAGASLVSLLATFLHFYEAENLHYNIVFAASAEEENSGLNGIELVLPEIGPIEFAIVGEPTQMHMAIAEKGLMVLDCTVKGKAGHAAREEGENALYKALKDIEWFKTFEFPIVSPTLGKVKMSVTIIQAGTLHNMVPETCTFTVDVRCTDAYTLEELLATIKANVSCEVSPRSLRMRPSSISLNHPVVQSGIALERTCYGSPTTSDQALMPFPSLKMGVGDSARSHTADEFVFLHEIKDGIDLYIDLLTPLLV